MPDGESQAAEEANLRDPLDEAAYRRECLDRERDGGPPHDERGGPKWLPEALANAPESKRTTGILDRATEVVESLTGGAPKRGAGVARKRCRDEVPNRDTQSKGCGGLTDGTKQIRDEGQECPDGEKNSERNETLLRRPELAELADGVADVAVTRSSCPYDDHENEEVYSGKKSESESKRQDDDLGPQGETRAFE